LRLRDRGGDMPRFTPRPFGRGQFPR
jgi:hypothetical protein